MPTKGSITRARINVGAGGIRFVAGEAGQYFASVNSTLTAKVGGGQSGATLCSAQINRFSTVASAADSGLLPSAVAGLEVTVINDAANSMSVFPATGDSINALSANAGFSLAAGKTATFSSAVNGKWHAVLSA